MGKLIEDWTKSGKLLASEGCLHRVRWVRGFASRMENSTWSTAPSPKQKRWSVASL